MTAGDKLEPEHDAELIAACEQWASLRQRCDGLLSRGDDLAPPDQASTGVIVSGALLEGRMQALEALIAATPARSWSGVKVKGQVTAELADADGPLYRRLLDALLADVKALSA